MHRERNTERRQAHASSEEPAIAAPVLDDEMSLEAAYQERILRYLVTIGSPFILLYGAAALLLSAPWYIMGLYLLSVVILAAGFAVLMRPMPMVGFIKVHRVVAVGYVAALMTVQVISIAIFNRVEFSAWILFYPSLVLLFMSRKDGIPTIVLCGVTFFVPLFLAAPVTISGVSILAMEANLLLIFVLIAVCTYFIDRTRRQFQSDLVRKQQEALRMQQAAEQASRAKSESLGNMSHELRTPLNHVIGFSELLLEMANGRGDGTSAEYLADILASGRHLLALVNDTLDLARVEEGRLALTVRPVTPHELLERATGLVIDRGREKRVEVVVAPDIPERSFTADLVRLTQVLVNLLVNAVKFTPQGGRVTAGCRIVDGHDTERPMVEFSLTDTGIGMTAEQIPLLFERFSRLDRSGYAAEQGAGLGLALNKGLVERHGGRIWAESPGEGRGSTLRFQVPIL